MKVPLDYAHPVTADDLYLAVARKKAAGPGKRLGSLLVNPGGPGGSAIDYLQGTRRSATPRRSRARYDMVAVDPRGVARSEPVECLTDKQMDAYTAVDSTPDDSAETDKLVAADKSFAAGCEKRSGKLLRHVSTVDAARDMDILRALLGDEKLTTSGRPTAPSSAPPTPTSSPSASAGSSSTAPWTRPSAPCEADRDQTGGFETAFPSFAEDCVKHDGCPLGTTSAADAGTASTPSSAPGRQPAPHRRAPAGSPSPSRTTGVIAAMYDETAWPTAPRGPHQRAQGRRRPASCSSPTATTSATQTASTRT